MTKQKICGNCSKWKKDPGERNMGKCVQGGNDKIKLGIIRPVNKGIAIRYLGTPNITNILFGRWFGCRFFKRKTK